MAATSVRSLFRTSVGVVVALLMASAGYADTVRVIVDRALIWSTVTGVAIAVNQVKKDTLLMGARRDGDWFEVELPPGSSGPPAARNLRVGYIRVTQVAVESVSPVDRPIAATPVPTSVRPHGFLNIDAGYRRGDTDLTRHIVAFKGSYAEEGTIDANYGKDSGPVFDLVIGEHLWGPVSVGVGVSYSHHSRTVALDAKVPHPFFLQTPRDASFTTSPLSRSEAAIHVPILYTQPLSPWTDLTVFGGVTIFHVIQNFATGVTLNEQYPYDTVSIVSANVEHRTQTVVGFHVGADVTRYFTETVGVGANVRFSRATLDFPGDANATTAGRAGGLQVTGGFRFRF